MVLSNAERQSDAVGTVSNPEGETSGEWISGRENRVCISNNVFIFKLYIYI